MRHIVKNGAFWLGDDERHGAELVFERFVPDGGLAAVFYKRELYYTRLFYRAEGDPDQARTYWSGSQPSWFATFDEAVAEALRLLKTREAD